MCRERHSVSDHILHAALCLLLLAGSAHADTWVPLHQEWLGTNGFQLGASIAYGFGMDALDNMVLNRVYVGEPRATDGTYPECGAVAVYVPGTGGWDYAGVIYANQRQAGAHFGASLAATAAGHIVVGAPDYNSVNGVGAGAGRVEFFYDSGLPALNISYVDGITGNGGNFGSAVAVDDDKAAAAAVNANGGDGCVSAFHYNPSTKQWYNLPTLNDVACGSGGEKLGASLAIRRTGDSTYLLVAGAPGQTQNGNLLAGGAHVFTPNPDAGVGGLLEVGTLAADNPAGFDYFGTSVGIDSNYVYVGATGRDNGAGRVGSVTIFKPAFLLGYDWLAEYFPGAPATVGGLCGASLGVDPQHSQFILGCPGSETAYFPHVGTARVFKQYMFLGHPIWLESVLSLGSMYQNNGAALGASVTLYGKYAFVGAPHERYPNQADNGAWKAFVPDLIFSDSFE